MLQFKKLSIVIPVYNEVATIQTVVEQVSKASVLGLVKEIILVDDKSTDGTTDLLKNLQDENIKIVYHEKNQGKGAALHTGFKVATGDIVVIQDADLEYDPKEIEIVLKPFLTQNAQVVYGSRYLDFQKRKQLKFLHTFFNRVFTQVANLFCGTQLTDIMTCYKAFGREAMNSFVGKLKSQRFGFEPEVTSKLARAGFKIVEVPVSYTPRSKKQGKHMNFRGQIESFFALIKYSLFD